MINIGLVVEGPHDLLMLPPLVAAEIGRRTKEQVRFIELQPTPDATTGTYSDGGWYRVTAWCKANAGAKFRSFFVPLFEDSPACDAILIHMDGDALEHIAPHTAISFPVAPYSPTQRTDLVSKAIESWLSIPERDRRQVAFAIPVMQSEAWILCSSSTIADCEQIDAKGRLQRSYRRRKHGPLAAFYTLKSSGIGSKMDDIARQSESYRHFRAEVEALNGL